MLNSPTLNAENNVTAVMEWRDEHRACVGALA